jgi:hypothetical protein
MAETQCVPLTHHGHDEHDEESIEHWDERHPKGGEDLLGGFEAAEEPHDAQGAQHADGEVEGAQNDEGHRHHHGVEEGPWVRHELSNPVSEDVDEELDGEDDGEGRVQDIQVRFHAGHRAIRIVKHLFLHLSLDRRSKKILRNTASQ